MSGPGPPLRVEVLTPSLELAVNAYRMNSNIKFTVSWRFLAFHLVLALANDSFDLFVFSRIFRFSFHFLPVLDIIYVIMARR